MFSVSPKPLRVLLCLASATLSLLPARGQQAGAPTSPQRDPVAVSALIQLVSTANSASTTDLKDFTVSAILSRWAGKDVSGTIKLEGIGLEHLRATVNLPDGQRQWVAHSGRAQAKDNHATVTNLPPHIAEEGNYYFPLQMIAAITASPDALIKDAGIETENGISLEHIQIQRALPLARDPGGAISKNLLLDLYIDLAAQQLVRIDHRAHSPTNMNASIPCSVVFSDYRAEGSWIIPHTINEYFGTMLINSIDINALSINSGLTPSSLVLTN